MNPMADNYQPLVDYNSYEFNETVEQFLVSNALIISKLDTILAKVCKHKTTCNVVKTLGTSVSGIGSICVATGLVLTPFTAGLSSVVMIGGSVATAVGTVTNISTDLSNHFITKSLMKEIEELAQKRNEYVLNLNQKFREFNALLVKLNNSDSHESDNVLDYVKIFKHMANGSVGAYKLVNNSVKLLDAVKEAKAANAINAAKSVGEGSGVLTSIGNFQKIKNLFSTEAQVTNSVFRSTAPAVGKNLLKGATAVAGLAFTVVDVVSLVEDWKTTHPTIDVINKLIAELQSDSKFVKSIHEIITNDNCDYRLVDEILNTIDSNCNCFGYNEPEVEINLIENRVFYQN